MHIEELRDYCLSLPLVEEKFPFDEVTLVFYIAGKMFCLTNINQFNSVNVKCDPDNALELRATYNAVNAGYHMNKKHWNSIRTKGTITSDQFKEWIKNSYDLVVAGLSKKNQKELL